MEHVLCIVTICTPDCFKESLKKYIALGKHEGTILRIHLSKKSQLKVW